jgi:signal transduction histidine kinase
VATLAWIGLPALLAAPIYAWSIPGWVHHNDVWISILAPLLAVPGAVLGAWLLHPTAVGQARLAALVLGPSRAQQLRQRVQTLAETRAGAVDAAVSELQRVERDLHDGAQARLVALSLLLGRTEERLNDRPAEAELVRQARAEASAAIGELRDLARGIAPPVLADRGLVAAVEALAARAPAEVNVDADQFTRLPPVVETAAYFVVAEALTNVAKHAPGARVRIAIHLRSAMLRVEVADDGPGGADPQGSGLMGLRHRVEALDGSLRVESGAGTTIVAEIPCEP